MLPKIRAAYINFEDLQDQNSGMVNLNKGVENEGLFSNIELNLPITISNISSITSDNIQSKIERMYEGKIFESILDTSILKNGSNNLKYKIKDSEYVSYQIILTININGQQYQIFSNKYLYISKDDSTNSQISKYLNVA